MSKNNSFDGVAEAYEAATKPASPRKVHAMLDIETLGTRPGCVVHEVAVVIFDPQTFEPVAGFHAVVDIHNAAGAYGLTVEAATLEWWEKQGGPVQHNARPLATVLEDLAEFIRAHKPAFMWARGKDFDFPILGACFDRAGKAAPWDYWQLKCSRDLVKLAGYKREGKPTHAATEDALAQVEDLAEAVQIMQRGRLCLESWKFKEEPTVAATDDQAPRWRAMARRVWDVLAFIGLVLALGWALGAGMAQGFVEGGAL